MQKENFKVFVQKNPHLINYVRNGKMTWQQFYEMFDLYGENNNIWNNYLENNNSDNINSNSNNVNLVGTIKDFLGLFKGLDLNTVQRTLTSLDKAIGAFKDFNSERSNSNPDVNTYEERPMYKYFED